MFCQLLLLLWKRREKKERERGETVLESELRSIFDSIALLTCITSTDLRSLTILRGNDTARQNFLKNQSWLFHDGHYSTVVEEAYF